MNHVCEPLKILTKSGAVCSPENLLKIIYNFAVLDEGPNRSSLCQISFSVFFNSIPKEVAMQK